MNVILDYFGDDTIERAVAYYFARHGVSEEVRDFLLYLEGENPDQFLELVCDFVEGGMPRVEAPEK